jgi:hypothetical protein
MISLLTLLCLVSVAQARPLEERRSVAREALHAPCTSSLMQTRGVPWPCVREWLEALNQRMEQRRRLIERWLEQRPSLGSEW